MATRGRLGELTGRHRAFADRYLVHLNATRAYTEAGYKAKDDDVAGAAASRLLGSVRIAEYVAARQDKVAAKHGITAERVLAEYAKLAFGDSRKVMSWSSDGVRLVPSGELDDDTAACVAEVIETNGVSGSSTRVKLHSKTEALNALAKHLGLFAKDNEIQIKMSLASLLAQAVEIDTEDDE